MAMSDNYPLTAIPGAQGLWHILNRSPSFGGDVWIHLIPGKDKAILLDTGFGIGDLKGMVEKLTDLPIIVVNSHFHGDHAGGNAAWDKVYAHKLDAPILREMMKKDPAPVPEEDKKQYNYFESDLVPKKDYDIEEFEDGYVFDLGGGYEVEVFHLPGHSEGCCGLLDRKRRIFFSGDCIIGTHILFTSSSPDQKITPNMTIENYRKGIQRLMDHFDEFDSVYPSHSNLGMSKQLVTDFAACCDELLAGDLTAHAYVTAFPGTPIFGKPYHIHGMAKIAFDAARIHVQ